MRSIVLIGLAVLIGAGAFIAVSWAPGGGTAEITSAANGLLVTEASTGEIRSSSPISIDVRIAAQRLADRAVRFGLRVRDGSGGWSAPVRPRAHRFDPANASTGLWLVSSPLTLEVDGAGSARMVRSDQIEASPGGAVEFVSGLEGWSGDSRYSAYHDEDGELVTIVSTYSVAVGAPDGELRTTISCRHGEISLSIGNLPRDLGNGVATQQVPLTWSVDNGPSRSESLGVTTTTTALELEPNTGSRLADALLGHGSHLALAIGATPELAATIDLDELRGLPVYSNLRHCTGDVVRLGRTELRIRAQLRADGRIEFAVQQRSADGWGDNILPRARAIAAFGGATNWLSSTPVSIRVELEPPPEIILPDTVVPAVPEPITPVLRQGQRTASLSYWVRVEDVEGYDPTRLTSMVAAIHEEGPQLQIGCVGDERQVLLAMMPAEATGDLTLAIDETQLTATWHVRPGNGFTSLSPTDSDRIIRRLRQAQSLSVGMGEGGADPISFDLADMFETPIQTNIDQCGNYAEPAWQPLTGVDVQRDLNEYYSVAYPDWNDHQRVSQVRVNAIDAAPRPGEDFVHLLMTCRARELTLDIHRLPQAGESTTIRLQVDDGEWYSEPVAIWRNRDEPAIASFKTDLSRLKRGTTLTFELGAEQPVRGAFDLTDLLGTPIQANFDNCGREYWPAVRTYVPVIGSPERVSQNVRYLASQNHDDTVTTSIAATAVDAPAVEGAITINVTCLRSSELLAAVTVPSSAESDEAEVTLFVDDRRPVSSIWRVSGMGSGSFLHPPSSVQLMAQLRHASVVSIDVPEIIPERITVHLAGMFDSKVQGNLDECGYYRPGEVRKLPLQLDAHHVQQTYDRDRDLQVLRVWQREPGRTMPSMHAFELHYRNGAELIGLTLLCGGRGAGVAIHGSIVRSLVGDHVQVEWSLDGSAAQRETWSVVRSDNASAVSPPRARALIASWRHASELELRLPGASPISHLFDLKALFDSPTIDTLDACLAAPLPPQSLPVSGIPETTSGNLWFVADFLYGSSWLSSFVGLTDNGEAAEQSDALDTRSTLSIDCDVGGINVRVTDLDAAESMFISGDAVEVDWRTGGRPRSETWMAWTRFQRYAIAPRDHSAFYQALKNAHTLTIEVQSDPPITKTYELARHGFWDTPVQPNLDACDGS